MNSLHGLQVESSSAREWPRRCFGKIGAFDSLSAKVICFRWREGVKRLWHFTQHENFHAVRNRGAAAPRVSRPAPSRDGLGHPTNMRRKESRSSKCSARARNPARGARALPRREFQQLELRKSLSGELAPNQLARYSQSDSLPSRRCELDEDFNCHSSVQRREVARGHAAKYSGRGRSISQTRLGN